jgi:hypothetical protein
MVAHGEPYLTSARFQAKYTFEEKESDISGTVTELLQYKSGFEYDFMISHYFHFASCAIFHLYQ